MKRAGAWLLESGIQGEDGGVARYYRADIKQNRPVSSEITGYAVSVLVYLHNATGDDCYIEPAERAAQFLTRKAWRPEWGTIPFECPGNGTQYAYFFDCGIIARGLIGLWRQTGEREYLDAATCCGRAMRRDFRAGGGACHPILRLPEKTPEPVDGRWSRAAGCYQLKSALAWHELAEATGIAEFGGWYDESLAFALRTEREFLPGSDDDEKVMDRLHAYCYFLEGMLPRVTEPECAAAMRVGIDKTAAHLRRIAPRFARSDVFAQLLRMRLAAGWAGVAAIDRDAAESEARCLAGFQARHADRRVDGGFYFGRKDGLFLPHMNPVSTAFGLQALEMWRRHGSGEPATDWRGLI